jgi:hypothetical protein
MILKNLFLVIIKHRFLIASQMEATEARKSFICFDEPDMKAKFKISVNYFNSRSFSIFIFKNSVFSNKDCSRFKLACFIEHAYKIYISFVI